MPSMTKKYCSTISVRKMGFSQIASCKAQRFIKRSSKKQKRKYVVSPKDGKRSFYFNKNNPKKSFDVYIDKNPNDTISIKYKTVEDVKNTISKLERLFKNRKYPHKRIWQKIKNQKNMHYRKNISNF